MMESKNKSASNWITRIILFLFFTGSFTLKVITDFDLFEMSVVSSGFGFSWIGAILFVQFVCLLELIAAILSITGRYCKYQFGIYLLLVNCYILSFIGNYFDGQFLNFTLLYFESFWMSLFAFFTIIGAILIYYLNFYSKNDKSIFKWYIQYPLLTLLVSTFLILGPLNFRDFETNQEEYVKGISNWEPFQEELTNKYPSFIKQDYLVVFLSTNCDHCFRAAQKIGVSEKVFENKGKVIFVFWSKPTDFLFWESNFVTEEFLTSTNANVPFIKLSADITFNITGGSFPAFFEFRNGNVFRAYYGNQFNAKSFDEFYSN